jgi:uncharacterized protein YecE (DUF72 family)
MVEKKCDVYIGCSGWSYQHWRGCFYPDDVKSYKMLDFYLKNFNSVEVNSTFYHYPKIQTVKNWAKKGTEKFRFTIKANQLITHKKRLLDIDSPWNNFWASLAPLVDEKKLGAVLFQFPSSFSLYVQGLKDLLAILPSEEADFSFEFRHFSWYSEEIYSLLQEHKCDFVSLSWPKKEPFNEVLSQHKYFRFHGATRMIHYDYTKEELERWADIIEKAAEVAKRIYIYFNNDPQCNAPKNAKSLREIVEARGLSNPFYMDDTE